MKTAILITCFNRKEKTITCLESIFSQEAVKGFSADVFLVDDNSSDGTAPAVIARFPEVTLISGAGNLYWAGGMRLAWSEARKHHYDAYLLLNDDTILYPNAFEELISTQQYAERKYNRPGICIGSTMHPETGEHSYGGSLLRNLHFPVGQHAVIPDGKKPQPCHLGNANIMLVPKEVVATIGIFSDQYTHSIADYDYTLRAVKHNIPVLVCPGYCGTCVDDHGKNWLGREFSLSQRIAFMRSVKGLASKEYLIYIAEHFPLYYPIAWMKLWAKILFPFIWDRFKTTGS